VIVEFPRGVFKLPALRLMFWVLVYSARVESDLPNPVDIRESRGLSPDLEVLEWQLLGLEQRPGEFTNFGAAMINVLRHPAVVAVEVELEGLWNAHTSFVENTGRNVFDMSRHQRWETRSEELVEELMPLLRELDFSEVD